MKMNRFRANLHPAFFTKNPEAPTDVSESSEMEVEAKLDELKAPILEEFKAATYNLSTAINTGQEERILSRYTEDSQLRSDGKRFQERVNSTTTGKEGKKYKYSEVWDENIANGFWHLITALRENKYFEDKNLSEETAKIKEQYWNEVKKQYIDNVWFAWDKKFEGVRNNLFGRESKDYPANKIYCKLTKAPTIRATTDRSKVESYGSHFVSGVDTSADSEENLGDKKNRNFLSNDLPKYLWDIKTKKTQNIPTWLQVAINLLPIFNINQVRGSKEDRKQINKFLELSEKLTVSWNKDKALALLEVFDDGRRTGNEWADRYRQILEEYGIKVDKKYLDDIARAGNFYVRTQRLDNKLEDQHPIYLSVLKIIEDAGWVNQAVNKYKSVVEQSKIDEKKEKKEWYKDGKKLQERNHELYDMATMIWITDYTYATRLSEKDQRYFSETPIENIIANISNDETIDARDNIIWWSKTWSQFLDVFKQVWREKAISNLIERLNMESKVLWITLPPYTPEKDKDGLTTLEKDIKNGSTWPILLLQKIISNPGEDLHELLSKDTTKESTELVEKSKEAARKVIKGMDIEGLKRDELIPTLQTPESMCDGLATALYTEYKKWIWLWGKLSFDEWVNWLEMNTWIQVRDDGTVVVWIGLDYHKLVNLWKWWTMTPELSAWAFLPIWNRTFASVGLANEFAKNWLTKEWTKHKLGIKGGVALVDRAIPVVSLWLGWEQDKLGWLDEAEKQKQDFWKKVIEEALNELWEHGHWQLDFSNDKVVKDLKEQLKIIAEQNGVKKEEINSVVNETARLLIAHNKANISDEVVRELIAWNVADQYARAWREIRKAKVSEHSYLSWAGLGVFWATCAPVAWVYANLRKTDYDLDGYGDEWWERKLLEWENKEARDQGMLDARINQRLWLSDKEKLIFDDKEGCVIIPSATMSRVRVNEKMKWLMRKNNEGNVALLKETPMSTIMSIWSSIKSKELVVGWGTWENFPRLNTLNDGRFTTWAIDKEKVIALRDNVESINADTLNNELEKLKSQKPDDQILQEFKFDEASEEKFVKAYKQSVSKWLGLKINLKRKDNWEEAIIIADEPQEIEYKGLRLEYIRNLPEMLDAQARKIAGTVYNEASKLDNPYILRTVKHDKYWNKPRSAYTKFVENMEKEQYEDAKNNIKSIFEDLDTKYNNKSNFCSVLADLDKLEGNTLWQALMSIRNVFARTCDVKKWNWEEKYSFKTKLWDIIERRSIQIKDTINTSLKEDDPNAAKNAKEAYSALIDASEKYRKNSKKFDVAKANAEQLGNTVWFNLWDKKNPENPLFNPEIYNPMVNLDELKGFSPEQKNTLYERAMKLFATNKVLIAPILKALWLPEDSKVTPKDFENWQLSLDIWEWKDIRTIKLESNLEFGYFTQCVNHTIILSNIVATDGKGTKLDYKSGVNNGIINREWNGVGVLTNTSLWGGLFVNLWWNDGEPNFKPNSNNGNDGLHTPGGVNTTAWQNNQNPGSWGPWTWNNGNGYNPQSPWGGWLN